MLTLLFGMAGRPTMISYIIVSFLIGLFVGAFIGLAVASLCMAAGDADERAGYK